MKTFFETVLARLIDLIPQKWMDWFFRKPQDWGG